MAVNPQQELIWQGRIHLGDEPGVYGDAAYAGLCAELPITVFRTDPANTSSSFDLVLQSDALETYAGYPGHSIVVVIYEPDPNQPYHSIERQVAQEFFKGSDNNRKTVQLSVPAGAGPFRFSVRLRCDTSVNPGFYDDFVWLQLSLTSSNAAFYASVGFTS